jgi:purine-binding chemotaxis protein CheW
MSTANSFSVNGRSATATADDSAAAGTVTIRNIVTFWIAGRLYGIDILDIREINGETSVTPIFHAPPQVRGFVNIRGSIHLVVEPRITLGLPPLPEGSAGSRSRNQLLVFKPAVVETFAVLVDRIGDIVAVANDRIDPPEHVPQGQPQLSAGVCKLDGQLIELLNPRGFALLQG